MKSYLHLTFLFFFFTLLPQTIQAADTAPAPAADAAKNYDSVEERRLAATILQERASIRREREDISMRKKELKTLEEGVDKKLTEMDAKLAELRELQKKIDSVLADKSAKEKKRIQDLANIYQKMSPDKAALAITGLDQRLAADLLASMKVKAAAKILDQTSKLKTTEISTTFTTLQLE
ncbi:hypothetical protein FCL47_11865 [Desulfopila sp. IMCC35006]|uniref:MotE family protein n=1 Tax=Desulfopila sp. IMCC35006 TaxID=2569542 RepID=UPI0010AB9E35|nr:hypothetical protein [Desulfopila sp. IMCC35006]TKB25796.1 hypothetical protein FCL47_11865 [Desulfopila sp. IMCC35006]